MKLINALSAVALATALSGSGALAQDTIRIGWAISKTGPFAAGASVTTLPNYQVWVKDVNDAGGIMLKSTGKKAKIEIVEYDDRSNSEEMIKAVERLATQDKVDFILPPWSTGLNLAVAPVLNKYGYPHLAVTANSNRAPEMVKRWPNLTFWLGLPSELIDGLVDTLTTMRRDGKIGDKVAMAAVGDQFGIEQSTAAREGLKKAGFNLVYDKSYPFGTQDLQPVIKDAQAAGPDSFIAFSYPPDTIGLTDQAKVSGFSPKVFYVGVGTAFPIYKGKFGASAEGVMGVGGSNADLPGIKWYIQHHKEIIGREPDRWASPITYASLQVLQQAIERVGKIDREAIIKEINTGSFETIVGKVQLKDNLYKGVWAVGQWQGNDFYGIAPQQDGVRAPIVPKPAWQ
ncbi:MAG: branched-chain amino acid transport system substrate-binding protein [Alphaproteobacteria bacterium]|jgi:branched-chain amino acid transport system substrate-binding protein|nr:branched-chain amino acid transport system substrate-binding protein [Alphaproteobacteria bacterium]